MHTHISIPHSIRSVSGYACVHSTGDTRAYVDELVNQRFWRILGRKIRNKPESQVIGAGDGVRADLEV
jgi:hypothetical protein